MFTHTQIWSGIDRLASSSGYSPSGLARQAGLDPTSFNKSKRVSPDGKPRWPSTESISKVLSVTGATMSDFLALIDAEDEIPARKMSKSASVARKTAKILLDTKSVLFNSKKPFILKSGKPSPVYVDCRRLISFAKERSALMDSAAAMLTQDPGLKAIDYVAGGETAGIPYGAFLAERLKKPMLYVRKEPKGYGRQAQIEGVLPEEGKKFNVLLVEDLQTDGGSKQIFIDALRNAGANVEHTFVVFHYGIFPASEKNMEKLGVSLHALATWRDVLEVAREGKYFDKETLLSVESFINDPEGWIKSRTKKA
jgi:orotate phosphoribosyltransferase